MDRQEKKKKYVNGKQGYPLRNGGVPQPLFHCEAWSTLIPTSLISDPGLSYTGHVNRPCKLRHGIMQEEGVFVAFSGGSAKKKSSAGQAWVSNPSACSRSMIRVYRRLHQMLSRAQGEIFRLPPKPWSFVRGCSSGTKKCLEAEKKTKSGGEKP